MSEDNLSELEIFSAILLEEYIRLMTAAFYIQSEDKKGSVKFKITPDVYRQMREYEVQAPLIGLNLEYDEQSETLTVSGSETFIKTYENKIQAEVALKFANEYKTRYSNYISII